MEIWWKIKSKVRGETCARATLHKKNLSRGALGLNSGLRCDRPATCRLVQYSECNNAIWYFDGANCREMCAILWREYVSSVCCEGESCGSVWTTEIWKSIKTNRWRIENSKSANIAVCPDKLNWSSISASDSCISTEISESFDLHSFFHIR